MRLKDKVVVFTEAGEGASFGRSWAIAAAREGARVVIGDRRVEHAVELADEIGRGGAPALALELDVTNEASIARAAERIRKELGRLDVLVNGAAWAQPNTPVHETSDELYQRTFDVCMTSVFWTTRAAYPHLKKSGNASVINFASNAGTEGMAGNAVYAASKEAIRGFSRSLAREWGRDGIRVNMIRPIAASPSLAGWIEANPKLAAVQARAIPLGRFGDCDADIAPVAVFLASDESRYLTAVTLPADGGGGQER